MSRLSVCSSCIVIPLITSELKEMQSFKDVTFFFFFFFFFFLGGGRGGIVTYDLLSLEHQNCYNTIMDLSHHRWNVEALHEWKNEMPLLEKN